MTICHPETSVGHAFDYRCAELTPWVQGIAVPQALPAPGQSVSLLPTTHQRAITALRDLDYVERNTDLDAARMT